MSIGPDEVRAVAALARLDLDAGEAERMAAQLNGILVHMDALRALDVSAVPPFTLAAEGAAPLRVDEPGADVLHAAPATFAPAWQDGFFTVPRLAAQRGT